MSDIQRWAEGFRGGGVRAEDGEWVTYADHVEALRQAEQAHREALAEFMGAAYEQGQRDALAAAVQRIEALDTGPRYWSEVIAAIKGDSDERP